MLSPDIKLRSHVARNRTVRGVSQNMLAELAGVSPTYIHQLETGRIKAPSWLVVCRIEAALGLKPGHFARRCWGSQRRARK